MTHNPVDTEAAARKRQEIGLSPRRSTSQSDVMRPPDKAQNPPSLAQWLAIIALSIISLILIYMIVLRIGNGQPQVDAFGNRINSAVNTTMQRAVDSLPALSAGSASLFAGNDSGLPLREEFSSEAGPLVRDFQPRRWSMGAVPSEGVYRIRMWPGVVAWSTLGVVPAKPYRLSASLTISNETPWGYGGLMTRYSDDRNFIFAQIDGRGRYRVQLQEDGAWTTLQEWSEAAPLQTAGLPNDLVLEDDGIAIRFFANGEALYTSEPIAIVAGDTGVVAGSLDPAVAEVNFDWVAMTLLQ